MPRQAGLVDRDGTGRGAGRAGLVDRDGTGRGAGQAGLVDRDGTGRGAGPGGFGQDGALDVLAAGMALAGFADEAHARMAGLSDDETSDAVWLSSCDGVYVGLAGLGKAVFSL